MVVPSSGELDQNVALATDLTRMPRDEITVGQRRVEVGGQPGWGLWEREGIGGQ